MKKTTKINCTAIVLLSALEVACLLWFFLLKRNGHHGKYDIFLFFLTFLILPYAIIGTLRRYTFSESGITATFLRIPYRRIKWSEVRQIGIIVEKYGVKYIQITLQFAMRYHPRQEYLDLLRLDVYRIRNFPNVITILATQEHLELVKEFYGYLDYDESSDRGTTKQ